MAQQVSKASFIATNSTDFPDNVSGQISPADLRGQMDNVATSVPFIITGTNTAPTANDDINGTNGTLTDSGLLATFAVGDIWINELTNDIYVCADNTATAAQWVIAGGSSVVQRTGTPANGQIALWVNDTEVQGSSTLTFDGSMFIADAEPGVEFDDLDGAAEQRRWLQWADQGPLKVNAVSDAGINGTQYFAFERTDSDVTSIALSTTGIADMRLSRDSLDFVGANAFIGTVNTNSMTVKTTNLPRLTVSSSGDLILFGDTTNSRTFTLGDTSLSTGEVAIEVGTGRTGDGASRMDFVTDTTYTDFGLRLTRFAGENGNSQMIQRGLGDMLFRTEEAANILFDTNSLTRLAIDGNSGAAAFTGDILAGAAIGVADMTSPTGDLHIARYASAGATAYFQTHIDDATDMEIFFRKARGGLETPAAIVAADSLGAIVFQGYDGADWQEGARIHVDTTTNTGNFDADVIVSTNAGESLRINSTGLSTNGGTDTFKYETGVWTPQVSETAGAGGNAAQGSTYGYYVKIGEMVMIQARITAIDTTGLTAGNQIFVTGLPFTSTNDVDDTWVGTCETDDLFFTNTPHAWIGPGVDAVQLRESVSSGPAQFLTIGDFTSSSGGLDFTITYRTSA